MALTAGEVLDGKYRVGRLLGEGGMGAVYEGEHVLIRRKIAIKALRPDVATADIVQRFEREAQAAGTIGNDHILEVMDLGRRPDGTRYMVMEYLDGETLTARMRKAGRLSTENLSLIVRQVLTGLTAAHDAGIIHRDLKPDNIFILREKAGNTDFVKLIDFGISRFTASSAEAMRVTKAGMLLGTPVYMSPEQARGRTDTDVRTDIYALGVIMYEALTGVLPFDSTSFHDLLFKIVLATPTPIEQLVPGVDAHFIAIVRRAMAREPNDRYASTRDFARDLEDWMRPRTLVRGSAASLPDYMPPRPSVPSFDEAEAVESTRLLQYQPAVDSTATPAPKHDSHGQDRTWAATQSGQAPKKKAPALGLIGLGLLVTAAIAGAAVFGVAHRHKRTAAAAPPAGLVASAPTSVASASAGRAESGSAAPPVEKAAATDPTSAAATTSTAPSASSAPRPAAASSAKGKRPRRPTSASPSAAPAAPPIPDLGY